MKVTVYLDGGDSPVFIFDAGNLTVAPVQVDRPRVHLLLTQARDAIAPRADEQLSYSEHARQVVEASLGPMPPRPRVP